MYLQDGLEISANAHTEIVHSNARCSLTLLDTSTEDCGTYTCIASNSFGQTSCHAKLTVDAGESQLQTSYINIILTFILYIFEECVWITNFETALDKWS